MPLSPTEPACKVNREKQFSSDRACLAVDFRAQGSMRIVALLYLMASFTALGSEGPDEKTRLAVEALLRLSGTSVQQNQKLSETVSKFLARTAGTEDFVRLVEHFKVQGQEDGLLTVAVRNPKSDFGAEAMRLVVASGKHDRIRATLAGSDAEAARNCVEALGNCRAKEATDLLIPLVLDEKADTGARRQAVKSLAQMQDGAKGLLQLT